ncbi:unnamed protein product, partial [Adineta ricciae]
KYEKYLTGVGFSFGNYSYCNCSENWFGDQCQYSFDTKAPFEDIVGHQFEEKESLAEQYDIVNDEFLLTCYEGLRCHSTICLDWREICDGIHNCEHGEDEPDECFLLELNQCATDEYRCRNGMCIPRNFLLDFSADCSDLSDEYGEYIQTSDNSFCSFTASFPCDFRLCNLKRISCGDGQCQEIGQDCNNGRDLFFRHNILAIPSNTSFQCWFLMLCMTGEVNTNLMGYNYHDCLFSYDSTEEFTFFDSFRKICPSSFWFQSEANSVYPFVRYFYSNTTNHNGKWWVPTHICYNQSQCPRLSFPGSFVINNFLCIEQEFTENLYYDISEEIRLTFSSCRPIPESVLNDATIPYLFYCNQSMKYISKHRVADGHSDCTDDDDDWDNIDSTIIDSLNLTDRVQCPPQSDWLPVVLAKSQHCNEKTYELYLGECRIATDIRCKYLRGLYISPIQYTFRENCNYRQVLDDSVANETDETSCEEWRSYRCDMFWDTKTGEDELNCSNTIFSYITHQVFKCGANQHYCAHRNSTISCLSKDRAGDGIIDCLGGTDEVAMYPGDRFPDFLCSNSLSILPLLLCDKVNDCSEGDDELICPWISNYTNTRLRYFVCKNQIGIAQARVCNDVIDCQPDGEDEWFCTLRYNRELHFSLDRLEEYPRQTSTRSFFQDTRKPVMMDFHSFKPQQHKHRQSSLLSKWFCNRGIIIKKRSSDLGCLCPPTYYGSRCQYHSERLLITLRMTRPANLNGHENKENAVRLIACLVFNDTITADCEEIIHVPMMKQMFYLNYPRPPPKQRGNWTVHLRAYSMTRFTVEYVSSWLFDVPFSFLPVNRLVLDLFLTEQKNCNTLSCNHGYCRKYLNSPSKEYCQCQPNWFGKSCNISSDCPCANGGICVYKSTCACSLGRIGDECYGLFNPCHNVKCENGGTCLPTDERLPQKYICSCRDGYHESFCELNDGQVDIYFSKTFHLNKYSSKPTIIVYFLELNNNSFGFLSIANRLLYKQIQLNNL